MDITLIVEALNNLSTTIFIGLVIHAVITS